MLSTRLSRPAAAGLGSIVLACGVAAGVMAASTAHADVLGAMAVSPATGTDTSGVTLTTAGACPSDATNIIVSVTGSGFPAAGQNVVSNSPISTYQSTPSGGIAVPLTQTMRDYANTAGFSTLKGRYDFTLTCRAAFGSSTFGDFTASMWFTSNTTYQNTDPSLPTGTPTDTTSPSGTPTDTTSPSGTPTDTTSPSGTPTDTTSPSGTPTDTTSPSGTPTDTTSPTDTPTDTATPTDSATATPTDTASTGGSTSGGSSDGGSSQGVSTTVGGNGSLAHTGTDVAVIGSAAGILLLVGGAAVWQTRRRREQAAELTLND
ncbi:LPXTG cell wall anchor domain-containing protein [Streptomyces sp. NPDC051976]|uniref:LPXTG cell wall anchor domain-containing protein n=1 Tax=Streptomyces sp. NPDC051976 TaxID=3154947 RepID=UPI0034184152